MKRTVEFCVLQKMEGGKVVWVSKDAWRPDEAETYRSEAAKRGVEIAISRIKLSIRGDMPLKILSFSV